MDTIIQHTLQDTTRDATGPFARDLARMRQAGICRRASEIRRRSDDSLARAGRILAALEQVALAQACIERLAGELAAEVSPEIRCSRRLYDGRWMVSARLDELWLEPDGCPRSATSQVSFLLEAAAESGHVRIECHTTVRGRDLPVDRADTEPAPDGEATLAAFVERSLLEFAEALLDRTRTASPALRCRSTRPAM
jgi:hypothetical protein